MGASKPNVKTNFIYSAIYNIIAIIIPLITTPYLSRTLGAYGLGEYSYAYSIAYYFSLFIKLGLNNYGGREIAYQRGQGKDNSLLFWELYALQASLGGIVSALYLGYSFLLSRNQSLSIIFLLLLVSSAVDITWFFWGLEEFKITVRRDLLIKILTTSGIFIFVQNKGDIWKYALLISAGMLLSQLLLWPILFKRITLVKPSFAGIVRHIRPNLILFLPVIALSLYKIMDKVMIGVLSTNIELGYYHASENVIQVPIALITALGTVMQPHMSNLISHETETMQLHTIFEKSIIIVMALSTAVSFGIMTVSKEFVPLFYGRGFEKCVSLFYILLPSCIFIAFANVIRTQYLIPNQKDKEYVLSLFLGAIVNLVLNIILIPILKSMGAALGTLAAEAAVCILQSILTRKSLKTGKLIILTIPFIFSGVGMFLIWHNITMRVTNAFLSLMIKIVAAGISYLVILVILVFLWKKIFAINYKQLIKKK